jgi:hypothetical protein
MLYELRIYHSSPDKLPKLHARFQNHTLKFWERYGIRQVGFWTQLIGENNQDLLYIIAWENLAEREKKWNAFMADSDWIALKVETEKDGPLYSHITNMILIPTAYSALK